MNCRHCGGYLENKFLDLGYSPPSNAYLTIADLKAPEYYFPLRLFVCVKCWLVQTEDFSRPEQLFNKDYAYFSSVSISWLNHAKSFAKMITEKLNLGQKSFVVEIASNDGYLLKNFVAAGIPCLGIEPTDSTATVAEKQGIKVLREFFCTKLALNLIKDNCGADLIVANNVLAHVPDVNDFTNGLRFLLNKGGLITLEFPHLLNLLKNNQFDTIYHEHFSYFSLYSVSKILQQSYLRIYDVEKLPTHGGSLRLYVVHEHDARITSDSVKKLLEEELQERLFDISTYSSFQKKIENIKDDLLEFLIKEKRIGRTVVGYGAAAKGNTLINFAGIKSDMVNFICDAAKSKQYHYSPGSHIPILPITALKKAKPDTVLIFPWNLSNEILEQCNYVREWGGKFYVAIPHLRELN